MSQDTHSQHSGRLIDHPNQVPNMENPDSRIRLKAKALWDSCILKAQRIVDMYNRFSGYDEEVDEYITDVVEETIQNTYTKYIQMVCGVIIGLSAVTAVMSIPDSKDVDKAAKLQTCYNSITFVVIFMGLLICLKYKPIYVLYFVPLLSGGSMYMCTLLTLEKDTYKPSEWHIAGACIAHILLILVPHQWKSSCLVFCILQLYFVYSIWAKFSFTDSDIIGNMVFSCLWFTLSSFMLMIKSRTMYAEIIKNKKLIREMKKVLQILPLGVVIWPSQASGKWFTNHEFNKKFAKIRQDLDELDDIDVSFVDNSDAAKAYKDIPSNLASLLRAQQQALDNKDAMSDTDATIQCSKLSANMLNNGDDAESEQRTCNVKTLMVEWEGATSYMHVFIDNTGVIKLEEAKNNIKCQKIMFASASHEFRNPLNSITNSIDIVFDAFKVINEVAQPYFATLSDETQEFVTMNTEMLTKFVKIGKSSSFLLLTLIEDMLNLSKMEAGTFTISKEHFKVERILTDVYDIFSMQCQRKALALDLHISEAARQREIYSDEMRLKQVILNLVSNSLKFTFGGAITISCRLLEYDGVCVAEFSVRDTGVGISREQQKKLFKLFSMITETNSLNPNGTGIGLTVSKKYVEAMGGQISLESAEGQGTLVTFTIRADEDVKQPADMVKAIKPAKEIWDIHDSSEEGSIPIDLIKRIKTGRCQVPIHQCREERKE
ncbi:unnamed protein product [Moneuplotes crassus]|uniref:histidine kinase n=1 Tax=Euplotes crassus TaxID=5936 RepID=A0AAD1Y357_EUPCR|nr:unnamed protein product [Moneuplotes crassus]